MASANKVVGMTVIILFMAISFPLLVTGAEDGTSERVVSITGGAGETTEVEDAIIVTTEDTGPNSVDIKLTSKATGDNATATLSEEETASLTLDSQTVTVTALSVASDAVTLRVIYPADFAWGDRSKLLSEQMPIIFMAVAVIILLGFVGVMVS